MAHKALDVLNPYMNMDCYSAALRESVWIDWSSVWVSWGEDEDECAHSRSCVCCLLALRSLQEGI